MELFSPSMIVGVAPFVLLVDVAHSTTIFYGSLNLSAPPLVSSFSLKLSLAPSNTLLAQRYFIGVGSTMFGDVFSPSLQPVLVASVVGPRLGVDGLVASGRASFGVAVPPLGPFATFGG